MKHRSRSLRGVFMGNSTGVVIGCSNYWSALAYPGKLGGPVYCLGITKEGYPRHPLYITSDTQAGVAGKEIRWLTE